jgi:hypothetical protein
LRRVLVALFCATALAAPGCSAADPSSGDSVARGEDGAVVRQDQVLASYLRVGDCIASTDVAEDEMVTVGPCGDAHPWMFFTATVVNAMPAVTSEPDAVRKAKPYCQTQLDVKKPEHVARHAGVEAIVQYQADEGALGSVLCFADAR